MFTVSPGNIYSGVNNPRVVLTNPTELAFKKGNLRQHYPVMVDGVVYADSEEAYQVLKKTSNRYALFSQREGLCAKVIEAKLRQYPRMVELIDHNGGVAWLEQCEHFTGARTKGFSEWEGVGRESAFIRALIKAYENAKS